MSRTFLPLHAADVSAFARSLREQLVGREQIPSHLELLNMLARSAGFRNFQHLRTDAVGKGAASVVAAPGQGAHPVQPEDMLQAGLSGQQTGGCTVAPGSSAAPATQPTADDLARARRVAHHFDAQGRLLRWPGKQSQRLPCLWVLWSRIPAREVLAEPQVNALLAAGHCFGDPALLRRWLCDLGMMTRTPDGREYRRVERKPPPDALALFERLRPAQ